MIYQLIKHMKLEMSESLQSLCYTGRQQYDVIIDKVDQIQLDNLHQCLGCTYEVKSCYKIEGNLHLHLVQLSL